MQKPGIFRKRYIPFETIDISGDELLYRSEEVLVTRWKAIKPRTDIFGGISYTFIKEGYKISRFYGNDMCFKYWYCDIIDVAYDMGKDTYTLTDLLVDVKMMPDGQIMVLDADELAEALEKGLVSQQQVSSSLRKLDSILKMIYEGNFPPQICRDEKYWIQ